MLTYKIHFLRHGLTQANYDSRYIGLTDEPLCENGRRQLEEMRGGGGYPAVEKVYASPLKRAVQSAEILFPQMEVETMEDLRELDFGAFENRTAQELEQDAQFCQWRASPPSARTPGGESGEDLLFRATRAAQSIFMRMAEEKMRSVAVVTHGGLIMSLLSGMGLPRRQMMFWNCEPGEGFTVMFSTQMWMRDQKFEICGVVPEKNPED